MVLIKGRLQINWIDIRDGLGASAETDYVYDNGFEPRHFERELTKIESYDIA